MNSILAFLNENWRRLGLEGYGMPSELTSVLITPRFQASKHVVFLILPIDQPEPVLAAKIPRLEGVSMKVEREASNLQVIQASRPQGFDSIPRVIVAEQKWGRSILLETALIGRPMDPPTVRGNPDGCCHAVVDWLVDLQEVTTTANEADPDWYDRLIARPLRYLERNLSTQDDGLLLQKTRSLAESLRESDLTLRFEHGDLSHPNILLIKGGGIGVLDWEQADPRGLPACDLFYFLTYIAFALHRSRSRGNHLIAFQEAFFSQSTWITPFVKNYSFQFHLSPPELTALFTLTWARYLTGLLMRLDDDERSEAGSKRATMAWLRDNRYFAIWKHAVVHADELVWNQAKGIFA